ncbi:zinc finger protein 236-like [Ctenocephalides felis]|uniref:zinc finger protein 236-like n=1 Tax=Ctenocephalides felis TaxID=7515 RepID=UPI000E6E376B|nr:zinc finger protein 236-like [Ctenocephalides felis]XP_026478910.1 zinc finger protein 236-like [Ctenocephalides felis]
MTCQENMDVCRVCLKNSEKFTNIFRTKINSVLVAEIVSICSSSYIWEEDGMPSSVCPACLHKLEGYWELRNCIKASENILRSNMQPQVQSTVDQSKFAQDFNQEAVSCVGLTAEQGKKIAESITIKIEPDCFKSMLMNEDKTTVRTTIDFQDCLDKLTRESGVLNEDVEELVNANKILTNVIDIDDPKDQQQTDQCDRLKSLKRPLSNLVVCDKCEAEFETLELLDMHYKCKHMKIKCKSCKKSFSPDKMKVHNETVHTGSKMFKCQICNSYISLKYYDMHMAVHS